MVTTVQLSSLQPGDGTLPLANGGTGVTSLAQYGVLISASSYVASLTSTSSGLYLQSQSTSANPAWVTAPSATPGGANTYVQYNSSSTFAGSSLFAFSSATVSVMLGTEMGGVRLNRANGGIVSLYGVSTPGTPDIECYDSAGNRPIILGGSAGGSIGGLGWTYLNKIMWGSSTTVDAPGTKDTGVGRNSAGVVEINSGTAGTFRDLKSRTPIHTSAEVDLSYVYATPASTATVSMVDGQQRAILNSTGTIVNLTINLPPTPVDGQIAGAATTTAVTTLTVASTGSAAVVGAPTTLTAAGNFRVLYRAASTSWYPAP